MDIFQASATIGLRAFALPPGTLSSNANQQGLAAFQTSFPEADVAYSRRFKLAFEGEAVDLILSDGTYTEGFTFPEIAGVPEGIPSYIRITGTLKDNNDDAVVFPILAFASLSSAGRPSYSAAGGYALAFNAGSGWLLRYDDIATAEWLVDDDSINPADVDWTGSAQSPATGTPTVTGIGFSKSFDPSGKDLYGEDIPTMDELYGILIECLSGSIIGRTGDEYVELTAGEKRLSANVNSLESLLDTMEIEAVTNSEARVTVIGKSA